jgi:cytoskeleton protein RodZ
MADIGTTLREARIRARIDITEVEARTKIRAKYLRAIENEEWDLLPGPVYVKSFLRTYGEFLGVDTRALVDEFKRRYERPADNDLRPISSLGRERERRRRRRPRLGRVGVIVLALIVVAAALGVLGTLGGSNTSTSSTPSTPLASSSTSSTSSTAAGSTGAHTTTGHKAPAKHHRPAPPPKPTKVTVKLVATSLVYICVEDGNGKVLIPGVSYSAGQSIPTETASKLVMTLGNSTVQMKVNGKTVPVGPGAPVGYELTPGKTTVLPAAQRPTCG